MDTRVIYQVTALLVLIVVEGRTGKVAYVDFPESSLSQSAPCNLQNRITATVTTAYVTVTLRLRKNPDVGDDAPVYVVRHDKNGVKIIKDNILSYQSFPLPVSIRPFNGVMRNGTGKLRRFYARQKMDSAEYQDRDHFASVEISCHRSAANIIHYELNGILSLSDGMIYTIQKISGNVPLGHSVNMYEIQPVDSLNFGRGNVVLRVLDDVAVPEMRTHTQPTSGRRRSKRQTEPIYVDIVFLIDHSVYQRWYNRSEMSDTILRQNETKRNIRRHFAHIANGINLRFKTTSDRYNIRLVGYVIEDKQAEEWFTTVLGKEDPGSRAVSGVDLLKSVQNWTNTAESFPRHDHVVTWTAYDLYDKKGSFGNVSMVGIAYNGTICRAPAFSISLCQNTERMVFDMLTATHEVGHGLGALHDGEDNKCPKEDLYMMSTLRNRSLTNNHPFLFSSCSADYFRTHVNDILTTGSDLSRSCLLTSLSAGSVPDVSGEMPGQIYDPDTQCRMLFDQTSFFCRGVKQSNEDICKRMPCLDPKTGGCAGIYAADGTLCGNKKWCIAGECVYSDRAPPGNATCLFGNTPGAISNDETCDELIPVNLKYRCYDEASALWCCGTCLKYASSEADCKYGDNLWNTPCSLGQCRARNGTNYVDMCCDTCRAFRTTPTTTRQTTTSTDTKTATTPTTPTTTRQTTVSTTTTTATTTVTTQTRTTSAVTTTATSTTAITTEAITTFTVTITTTRQQTTNAPSATVATGGTRIIHSSATATLIATCYLCYLCIVRSMY